MSQEICAHEECEREAIGRINYNTQQIEYKRCIFHCEKDDWFTTDANGEQDWSKEAAKVKAFWDAFEQEWTDGKSDFSFFIFPLFTSDAYFLKDTKSRQLSVEKAKESLSFWGARFLGHADFWYVIFRQRTFFNEAIFTQGASFRRAIFQREVNFERAEFMQNADFRAATFEHWHNFGFATFKQKAYFSEVSYKKSGEFRNCIFEGDAFFAVTRDRSILRFRNVTFHARFTMGTLGRKPMALKSLTFVDCTFEKDANVYIGNIVADKLALIRLRNLSSLVKLMSIIVQKQFVLRDSTLSGAELNNIILAKNDGKEKWEAGIKMALSSFTSTAFNNVQWGEVKRIKADRDTFRQLKAANEEQKNYLQANEFYMMEMKRCGEEIKAKK